MYRDNYIKALRTARGWIMAQPMLDLPERPQQRCAGEACRVVRETG